MFTNSKEICSNAVFYSLVSVLGNIYTPLYRLEVELRTQGLRPRTQKKFQGQGQPFRGQTLSRPRTGMLKAKANQGHKRKCSPKKKSSQKFFRRSPQKNVFQKIFQALHKILTIQKIVLSLSRGQGNFRGLEASRPRTSKCVLEDSTSRHKLSNKIMHKAIHVTHSISNFFYDYNLIQCYKR